MEEINAAAKEYLETADLDALIIALFPAHSEVMYHAYAPYWLSHCHPVDDRDDTTEFTYYNDLIDMYWAWKWQEWKKKNELCVTIMLPPTRGLIDFQLREDQRKLKEYLRNIQSNSKSNSGTRVTGGK